MKSTNNPEIHFSHLSLTSIDDGCDSLVAVPSARRGVSPPCPGVLQVRAPSHHMQARLVLRVPAHCAH